MGLTGQSSFVVDAMCHYDIIIRCIEVVKSSHHAELASELEITKALTFLREKDIPRVSLFVHLFIYLSIYLSICLFIYLFVHSFIICLFIYLSVPQAIDTLKECGRKDNKMADSAATNLSFIYYLVSIY